MIGFNLVQGVNYYLSCWYRRSEFGIRAAIFFSAAALAGSFGGLLAAAIVNMDGVGGKPGWAWIFILEGLATIIVAGLSYFMVRSFTPTRSDLTRFRFMISQMRPNSSRKMIVAESSAASSSTNNQALNTKSLD